MKSIRILIAICLMFTAVNLFAQTENHRLMTVKDRDPSASWFRTISCLRVNTTSSRCYPSGQSALPAPTDGTRRL